MQSEIKWPTDPNPGTGLAHSTRGRPRLSPISTQLTKDLIFTVDNKSEGVGKWNIIKDGRREKKKMKWSRNKRYAIECFSFSILLIEYLENPLKITVFDYLFIELIVIEICRMRGVGECHSINNWVFCDS